MLQLVTANVIRICYKYQTIFDKINIFVIYSYCCKATGAKKSDRIRYSRKRMNLYIFHLRKILFLYIHKENEMSYVKRITSWVFYLSQL